jgi:hypothetical protein
MKTFYIILPFVAVLLSVASAFSPVVGRMPSQTRLAALQSTLSLGEHDNDSNYRYLFAKAKECAYSDQASEAEARSFLNRILEFESDCVSGALVGQPMCQNVDEVADIVSNLRAKVKSHAVDTRYVWGLLSIGHSFVAPYSQLPLFL